MKPSDEQNKTTISNSGWTVDQWQKIIEFDLPFPFEVATKIGVFTGLNPYALSHLRPEWIRWENKFVKINIPKTDDPCSIKTRTGYQYNSIPGVRPRNKPCDRCKRNDNKFKYRRGGSQNDTQSESVILHKEIAAPAVKLLDEIFNVHERPEIGLARNAITSLTQRMDEYFEGDEEFGDETYYNYNRFQRTGPVIYSHYGLTVSEIARITAWAEGTVKDIIASTPGVTQKRSSTKELLTNLKDIEPATAQELADKMGYSQRNAYERLRLLKQENKVKHRNSGKGQRKGKYETANDWTEPINCDECSFFSYSIQGIRQHRKKHQNDN